MLAWLRADDASSYLVAVNFGAEPADASRPPGSPPPGGSSCRTDPGHEGAIAGAGQPQGTPIDLADLQLAPAEGVPIRLRPTP